MLGRKQCSESHTGESAQAKGGREASRCTGDSAERKRTEMLTSEGRGEYFPASGHAASTSCQDTSLEAERKEDRFQGS